MPHRASVRPARRPTMGDVARHAGVSLKSVSRVVNGEAHVTPALAERVRQAITELGYRPNGPARGLAAMRPTGRLIGFVQVDAANGFFSSVHRGLEDATRERGLLILAGSTDGDPARERELIEALIEWRVDGLVVAAAEGADELLRDEIRRGTPVVCVDRILPELSCDTIVSSNRTSTARAVEHLLSLGHERVAFLGGDERVWTARERLAGYRDALRASGRGVDPQLEITDVGDVAPAARAVHRLLAGEDQPTAFFAAQDRICTGAVTALHELGRQEEIALFGFDDIPFAEQLQPSVSVVAQDPYEMGRRAGALLVDRLTVPARGEPELITIEAPLRHRASGSIPPTR